MIKLYHGTDMLDKKKKSKNVEKVWNASSDNIYFWNEENREKSIQNAKITGSLNFMKFNDKKSLNAVIYEITVSENDFELFNKDLHEGMDGAYCIDYELLKNLYEEKRISVRKIVIKNVTTPILSVFSLSLLHDLNMDNVDKYWVELIEAAFEGSIDGMHEFKDDKYYPMLQECIKKQDFLPLFKEALKKFDNSVFY